MEKSDVFDGSQMMIITHFYCSSMLNFRTGLHTSAKASLKASLADLEHQNFVITNGQCLGLVT